MKNKKKIIAGVVIALALLVGVEIIPSVVDPPTSCATPVTQNV